MEAYKNGIFSKWLIHGFPDYCIGTDKELYKLPYYSNHRFISLRRIKLQKGDRYKIDNNWWSKKQLKMRGYLNKNQSLLIKPINDLPF